MIIKRTNKQFFPVLFRVLFPVLLLVVSLPLLLACGKNHQEPDYEFPDPPKENREKPRYIWIDAAANFRDFANSRDNITRDLALAKDVGFTDIVVDVRPTSGDILFTSSVAGAEQVKWLGAWVDGVYSKVERTATWDYLQAFIDEGHRLGLKVHAGFNTMVGGHTSGLGSAGILYRDPSKKEWATYENLSTGIVNTMDRGGGTKFFNPVNDEVQAYLCGLLKDLAKYNIDGIVLDRGRFDGIQSDFSNLTREKFEAYLGNVKLTNFPEEVLPPGATMQQVMNMGTYPPYFTKWLEFRAKVMYDFMSKARDAVKSVNADIQFGVYVGGWYSTYYEVGVNWASPKYNTSHSYRWATPKYMEYGYAELMDQILIGAYASPLRVYGSTEWTMQGFCKLAKEKIRNSCPLVVGGPDVGNWDPDNKATRQQENQAIVNSVKACMDECDGYFLFDMIHLKLANQWQYVKEGINLAISGNK
ncbi:MAG TPA: family 10 glycosylhydrolase [Bacteroidales bacterium]|nr:family 10 glycosylhydrolase [Bacteroidales bacterium]